MALSTDKHYLIEKLSQDLTLFEKDNNLEAQLESTVKHLPAYIKIIKSHLSQLKNVLQLENHNRRGIENVSLAKPVQQLIKIFDLIQEEDLYIIDELHSLAKNWHLQANTEESKLQALQEISS